MDFRFKIVLHLAYVKIDTKVTYSSLNYRNRLIILKLKYCGLMGRHAISTNHFSGRIKTLSTRWLTVFFILYEIKLIYLISYKM